MSRVCLSSFLSVHLPSFTFSCPLSLPPPPPTHMSSVCLRAIFFPHLSFCFRPCVYSLVYSGVVLVFVSTILLLQVVIQEPCMFYKWDCKQHTCTTNGTASNMHALQMGLQATRMLYKWNCKQHECSTK